MNQKIVEQIEINVKSREEIQELMASKGPEMSEKLNNLIQQNNLSDEYFKNQITLLKDPAVFYNYIDKYHNISTEKILEESDLDLNLLQIIKTFELSDDASENAKPKEREKILRNRSSTQRSTTLMNAISFESIFKNLGFIYQGYKPDYYYWEIVFFSRKFFLIMIGVVSDKHKT